MSKALSFIAATVLALAIGIDLGHKGFTLPQLLPEVLHVTPDDDGSDTDQVKLEKPPVPGDGQHVLIVYESSTGAMLALSDDFQEILRSPELETWCSGKGWDLDRLDQDTVVEGDSPTQQWFRAALALPRESLPAIVISNGAAGYAGACPPNKASVKELIGRYQP